MANPNRPDRYEDEHFGFGDALTTGAAIAGGVLAFRNRRFLGQQMKRLGGGTLNQAGRAYTSVAHNLLTNPHVGETFGRYIRFSRALSAGLGEQTGVIRATRSVFNPAQTQFAQRFDASIERQLMKKAEKNINPVYQNSTAMSQYYFNNTYMKKGQSATDAFHVVQHDVLQRKIQQEMAEKHRGNLYQMLIDHQKKNKVNLFNNPTTDRVADFVTEFTGRGSIKKYGTALQLENENEAKAFVAKLTGLLHDHSTPQARGMVPHKQEVSQIKNNIDMINQKAFEEQFSKEQNRNTQSKLLSRGGHDYWQMTVGDYGKFNPAIDDMKVPLRRPNDSEGTHKTVNMMDEIKKHYDGKMNLDHLIVDPSIYINKHGHVLDLREANKGLYEAASFMQDSFQIPFLRFNFLDLAHFGTIRAVKESPKVFMMNAGETYGFVQHKLETFASHLDPKNATAVFKPLSRGGYMYAGGKVYDVKTMKVLDEGLYAGPQNHGPLGRMHDSMGNLRQKEEPQRGLVKSIFDIGAQQQDSFWGDTKDAIEKIADPFWAPNIQSTIAGAIHQPTEKRIEILKQSYERMHSTMQNNSMSLSNEAINHMAGAINDGFRTGGMNIDVRDLVTDERVMNALGEIVKRTQKGGNPSVFYSSTGAEEADGIVAQIHDTWRRYTSDPHLFLNAKDMEPDKSIALPDTIAPMQLHEPNLIKSTERARRLIHQYSINQMEIGSTEHGMARRLVEEGLYENVLTHRDTKQVRQLDVLNQVRNFHNKIYSGSRELEEEGLNEFAYKMVGDASFARDVQTTAKEFEPWYAAPPKETQGSITGSNTQIFRQHKSYRDKLQEINESYAAQGKIYGGPIDAVAKHGEVIWDTMKEMFAGRKSADKVTTLTAFPFYYTERMDNAVSGLGLSLNQTHRGSAVSILGNQFLRRVVLPYAAYQQAVWLDGQFNDAFSDGAADMYVNMHQDVGNMKEMLGINRAMRAWAPVFGGADQLAEAPGIKQFNFLTMGAFSDWRSGDDIQKYYESGEDAVRKNRYWGVGSVSPWSGSGVEYFEPNWYRKLKSDYKFTDTMYGSESEYWANNWMPTLTHPFAPVKHFFLDPYHYEDKHKDDRPYAVTGGFSEIQQIPLVGPTIDATVGRIIKPRQEHAGLEKAHRKYLAEMNANIANKYGELQDGHFIKRGVAGGITILEAPNTADDPTSEEQGRIEELAGGSGDGEGGVSIGGGTGSGMGGIATIGRGGKQVTSYGGISAGTGSGGSSSGSGMSGQMVAAGSLAQMDLTSRNNLLAAGGTGAPALTIDRYAKMLDPNMVVDSSKVGTVDNPLGTVRDAFYSASEIGGMYGFLTKTALGFDESGRGMTWASSNLMTSYSRQFWDMSLGGLGGQISEIGRRYVPRDPNKEYYSPIENTMPDWLPGLDYFLDFQHGDPYVKLKKGEMRLPGKSYETLYQLHPDGTGQGEWSGYGIFDRMRILADVAPYSNQYKNAKAMVSQMNQQGLLTPEMVDEYQDIRDQVSQRKDKYRWYKKRFTNASVKMENVTVTKVLDQNTFMTKEHPNNPIRLAGVKLSKDDEEAVNWLSQFIKQGANLRVALNADANERINSDTFNTMSAAVFAPHGEEGGSLSYSIKGQSLNYILANRKWSDGSTVRVNDNESSVSTYALFTNDMRAVGKGWETLTHDILPQIPIAGVFFDKFLQVRSPLESYERDQVYGKEWKPWTDPIGSWLKPAVETIANRNPLVAAAEGAGLGHLMMKGNMKGRGRIVGALVGGLAATARVAYDSTKNLTGDDHAWIPDRRKKQREIDEYFDRIKYVKYKGLYEKAKSIAKTKEGVDVEKFFDDAAVQGQKNKGLRKYIADKKKWLSMAKKSGYGDSAAIDAELDKMATGIGTQVEQDFTLSHAGPYATLAMQYRKEYESTLYGLDPKSSDMRDVLKAMTPKEREYFPEFLASNSAKERNRILEIVPNDMRRILQAKWGMKIDSKTNISNYFENHYLPDEKWEGWNPNTSLDNIKVKVMNKAGIEATESGYWQDDQARAEQSGVQAVPIHSMSSKFDMTRLTEVLRGAGLSDVKVTMNTTPGNGSNQINTVLNLFKDVKNDITNELNTQIHNIFSTN
jgi:hypothetical protein